LAALAIVQPDAAGLSPFGPVSWYGVARPAADSGFAGTMMSQLTFAAAVVAVAVAVAVALVEAEAVGVGWNRPNAVDDAFTPCELTAAATPATAATATTGTPIRRALFLDDRLRARGI